MQELGILGRVREWTVEANPETVTPELMAMLAGAGVNRVSLGAQSFDLTLLKKLERWHEPASVARAAGIVRDAGIANFNLDLIFAIPGQTLQTLDADLDAALALQPTHLSCYGLTYEPQTAMTKRLELGQFEPASEDLERAMYARVLERLDAAGFEQYEVSNWAKRAAGQDYRCLHNLFYWTNGWWLGVGPSAASHIDGWRWKNQAHLGHYLDAPQEPPIADLERLDPARSAGERLMLRLRLREGAPESFLREVLPAGDPRWEAIRSLRGMGMLEWSDGGAEAALATTGPEVLGPAARGGAERHLRLTPRGLFVADAVIRELL